MLKWVAQLDRILRGEATRVTAMRGGTIDVSARGLGIVIVVLGLVYGACMGVYSVVAHSGHDWRQMAASALKVPMLFLLTLLVTFPSLYVFNALVGSRLSIHSVLRLLVAAMAVMLAVLASFGTIVAFFSVSSASYPFILLLNVVVCTVAGVLGLSSLLQTLQRITDAQDGIEETPPPLITPPPIPAVEDLKEGSTPNWAQVARRARGALDADPARAPARHVRTVFRIWVIVFALVGAQMGWVLRPFVGNPAIAFTWFRARESNFFEGVIGALRHLFGA